MLYIEKWCENTLNTIIQEKEKIDKRFANYLKTNNNFVKNFSKLKKLGTVVTTEKIKSDAFEHHIILPAVFQYEKPVIGETYLPVEIVSKKIKKDDPKYIPEIAGTMMVHYNVYSELPEMVTKQNTVTYEEMDNIFNQYVKYLQKFMRNIKRTPITYEQLCRLDKVGIKEEMLLSQNQESNEMEKIIIKSPSIPKQIQKPDFSYRNLAYLYAKYNNLKEAGSPDSRLVYDEILIAEDFYKENEYVDPIYTGFDGVTKTPTNYQPTIYVYKDFTYNN